LQLFISGSIDPPYPLALFPLAHSLNRLLRAVLEQTESVHDAVQPLPVVVLAARPRELALAMLQVSVVLALVSAAIVPRERSPALHHVKMPLALIAAPIVPSIDAAPVYIVIEEFALVDGAVGPAENSMPILLAIHVLTRVGRFIRPFLVAGARLSILEPGAFKINTILMMVIEALTMIFIIQPFSVVDVPVAVDQTASSIGLIVYPGTFIERAVYIHTDSKTFSLVCLLVHKSIVVSFFIFKFFEF
jgi:hypothetical protein